MNKRDVSVLILHDGDKILLQKRSATAKRFPGKWGLFGGGLEQGELPETAIKREILEELSLELNNVNLIDKHDYVLKEGGESGTIFVFISKYLDEPISLLEGDDMRWVNIHECLNYDLSPDYRKIIKEIGQRQDFMVL